MAIDLEERIARLEAQVEAKLELDQLQREFAVLQSNPTVRIPWKNIITTILTRA